MTASGDSQLCLLGIVGCFLKQHHKAQNLPREASMPVIVDSLSTSSRCGVKRRSALSTCSHTTLTKDIRSCDFFGSMDLNCSCGSCGCSLKDALCARRKVPWLIFTNQGPTQRQQHTRHWTKQQDSGAGGGCNVAGDRLKPQADSPPGASLSISLNDPASSLRPTIKVKAKSVLNTAHPQNSAK